MALILAQGECKGTFQPDLDQGFRTIATILSRARQAAMLTRRMSLPLGTMEPM